MALVCECHEWKLIDKDLSDDIRDVKIGTRNLSSCEGRKVKWESHRTSLQNNLLNSSDRSKVRS